MSEKLETNTDNPANRQHMCAKNVVHEQWGKGTCIPTMHAEPDAQGNVAWYDVMFEHGIEKGVSVEDMQVVVAESHTHGKKKKMNEAMDPVNKKELKGSHADRKDKDIDNDGDVDSSDEFLHKRRKAISKALAKEEVDLDEGYSKSMTYKGVVERIGALERMLNPNSVLCKAISRDADNVVPEFKKMQKHIEEISAIWDEVEYIVAMSNQ